MYVDEDYDDGAGVGDVEELADITPYVERSKCVAAPLLPPPFPPPGMAREIQEKGGLANLVDAAKEAALPAAISEQDAQHHLEVYEE